MSGGSLFNSGLKPCPLLELRSAGGRRMRKVKAWLVTEVTETGETCS